GLARGSDTTVSRRPAMPDVGFTSDPVEMEADDEYRRQLDLFVRSCDEKARLLARLERLVARLPRRDSFLDVGAGAGDLTVPLSRHFDRTTAVEPNRLQAARLSEAHPRVRVRHAAVEDLDLGGE